MDIPSPEQDERYTKLIKELRTVHGDLRNKDLSENPALIGDYLGQLRLGANLLFSFLNKYIDILTTLQEEVAMKRKYIYDQEIKEKSVSTADLHSRNMTRVDEAKVKTVELRIQQIKNEYERYNGICIYLQSRMKEFNTERIMG